MILSSVLTFNSVLMLKSMLISRFILYIVLSRRFILDFERYFEARRDFDSPISQRK